MGNKGRSEPNAFGGYTHYDEKGKKIGRSEPSIFGGYTNYDAQGHKTGSSMQGFIGYNHYDTHGHKIGSSTPGFSGYNHYDVKGNKTGHSDPSIFGGYSNRSETQGCYIATCVYGSYDCPEVWVLRRFRDGVLANSTPGRLFIKVYYAISPKLVRQFGNKAWFRRPMQNWLDGFVMYLQSTGFSNTPYDDKATMIMGQLP